jgi:hypothetical protein
LILVEPKTRLLCYSCSKLQTRVAEIISVATKVLLVSEKPVQKQVDRFLTSFKTYLCRIGGRVGWRRLPVGGRTEDDLSRPPASYRPPSPGSTQSCGRSLAGLPLQNKQPNGILHGSSQFGMEFFHNSRTS